MSNEQSISCFDYRVHKKFIGYLGIIYSVIHIGFFAYLLVRIGAIKLLPILIFFSDVTAAILFFYGVDINQTYLVFISLVLWGVPLSIWIDAIFIVISQDISLSIGHSYVLEDIFIYTVAGVLIAFYLFFVISYRSMKRIIQESTKKANFDWRFVGLIVAVLIVAFTIGQMSYFSLLPYSLHSVVFYLAVVLISALNLTVSVTWCYGIAQTKSKFVLTSLFCWVASLVLWIGFLAFFIYLKRNPEFDIAGHRRYGAIYATAFYTALFIIAALCFRSMKRDILETMRLNAVYMMTTPVEMKQTDTKCNLIKISENGNENL